MKVLFVSSLLRADQKGGAVFREKSLREIYSRLGYDVVSVFQEGIERPFSLAGSIRRFAQRFFYGSAAASLFMPGRLPTDPIDILHLEHLKFLSWDLPKHKKLIYNAHNLEFENYFGRDESSARSRLMDYELSRFERCDVVFVCSERERRILLRARESLDGRVIVLPNLVNAADYSVSTKKNRVSFIGTLDYFPNRKAVNWILKDFIPSMKGRLPDVQWTVAGKNPSSDLRELTRAAGVELLTDLSDGEIRRVFSETRVLLVPLFSGSGTRLKIIEAIFSGCRVLSTELGAEGLESELITTCRLEDFGPAMDRLWQESSISAQSSWLEDFKPKGDLESWLLRNLDRIRPLL